MIPMNSLKLLVRTFYDIQDIRKKAGNRLGALEKIQRLTPEQASWLTEKSFNKLHETEKNILKDIGQEVRLHPIWTGWLQYVWGIADTLTGAMIADIEDISKFETVSRLWAYGGQHPICIVKNGNTQFRWFSTQDEADEFINSAVAREKETAEFWAAELKKPCTYDAVKKHEEYLKKCVWGPHHNWFHVASMRMVGLPDNVNHNLKVTFWKCGQQFLKGNPEKSKYRALYDECKTFYVERDTDQISPMTRKKFTKGQINNRALRKTVKIFISHLWVQWRKFEGLPVSKPYVIEKMGHVDYIEPFFDKEPN